MCVDQVPDFSGLWYFYGVYFYSNALAFAGNKDYLIRFALVYIDLPLLSHLAIMCRLF